MKKFLIALAVVSLSVSQVFAGGCCFNQGNAEPMGYSRAVIAEPSIPECTVIKQIPYTAYRPQVVHVPPVREEVPQAPIIRRVPQPDLVVRHKQAPIIRPDLICRTPQPCKFVCEEQPPLIRYSCPIGSRSDCGAPACAAPCA